jgi:tetratricopeptide (TPR) repeat protein
MIERTQAQLGTATWADLLARRYGKSDRRRFVGRRYEQEQFRLNYLYEVPQALLFVLQGPAGIGKTALLTRYREIAGEHRAITAVIDRGKLTLPREFAILQAMEMLADQMAAAGTPLTTYREVCREYLHAVRSIDADSAAPARVWNLFDGAADLDPWVQQAWDTYFTRSLSLRQSALIRDPVGTLTERFVQDLNAWAVVRRMVLCFDDWGPTEQAGDAAGSAQLSLESWLPTLLCRGQLSTNIWFVLTTRSPLAAQWNPLAPVARVFELQPLPKKEAISFLQEPPARSAPAPDYPAHGEERSRRLLSETEASSLVEAAKGSPLHLSLLACSKLTPGDSVAYLDQYIDSLKPIQQAALLKCTAARQLDEGVLNVLLGEDAAREALGWLASSPVIVESDATWHFRPTLRDPLMQLARARIGPAWEAAHQTLFAFYRQRVELQGATPHFLDTQWRHDRLEALYHELVQGDEADGIRRALLSFLEGVRRFYPWAGAVALTWLDAIHVRELAPRPAAGHQMAEKVYATWRCLVEHQWEESLVLVSEFLTLEELAEFPTMEEVKKQLDELRYLVTARLALPPEPEPERMSVSPAARATEAEAAQEPQTLFPPPTQAPSNGITSTEPVRSRALAGVGEGTGDRLSQEPPAVSEISGDSETSATSEMADSCEIEATSTDLAEDSERLGRARAIELCSEANTHMNQGDYKAAIQGYDEALAQSPDYIAAYYNRGSAYNRMGALSGAIADFTRVLELDPAQVPAYRQRGLLHARKSNYEQAIQDYDTALKLLSDAEPTTAEPGTLGAIIYDRANAYFRLGSYEQALADYTTTLEHTPEYVEGYLNRGLTYSALGNYPEALRDFNQAIVLAPQQALSYHHRGQVYARMERYTEALQDYDHALAINPRYASVHNNRGLLYVKIEAFPEAVEAYRQAMALQPDWATPYYNAGCAAALMEDVDNACTWLARAIALRENYRAMAVRDSDLAKIRQHPRFRALVESSG